VDEENRESGIREEGAPDASSGPATPSARRVPDPPADRPRRFRRWLRRIVVATGGLLLVVAGLGLFRHAIVARAIPPIAAPIVARELGVPVEIGRAAVHTEADGSLVVEEVRAEGLLDRAGIVPGGRILEMNGVDLTYLADGLGLHMQRAYGDARGTLHVGTMAEFTVERDGKLGGHEALVEVGIGSPHIDPWVGGQAGPVQEVELAPFFLSKYEMTQGQWSRLPARERFPSGFTTGNERGSGVVVTPEHPVESVTWVMCNELLSRCELTLPTEAQWEYAARAGTDTPWWCGAWPEDIQRHRGGNLYDLRSHADFFAVEWPHDPKLEDDHIHHAPVGAYAANLFGLHDVIGNVEEWCWDGKQRYGIHHEPGTGRTTFFATSRSSRCLRGGAFNESSNFARSGYRAADVAEHAFGPYGVRPARRLTGRRSEHRDRHSLAEWKGAPP